MRFWGKVFCSLFNTFVKFLTVHHYFSLQDIKISFEDVDFYANVSLILNTPVRNSKTQQTIVLITIPGLNWDTGVWVAQGVTAMHFTPGLPKIPVTFFKVGQS